MTTDCYDEVLDLIRDDIHKENYCARRTPSNRFKVRIKFLVAK